MAHANIAQILNFSRDVVIPIRHSAFTKLYGGFNVGTTNQHHINHYCFSEFCLDLTMAPHDEKKSKNDGEELSTILSHEEQVELTLLVANITEVMRKQITDTFDSSSVKKKDQDTGKSLKQTGKNPNVDETKKSEGDTKEEEEARELREKRDKELSAPKIKELKKAAEEYFDKWREALILRLGEVVNSPKKAQEQVKDASVEATPDAEKDTKTKVISKFTMDKIHSLVLHGLQTGVSHA
jgi:hypothetical protein